MNYVARREALEFSDYCWMLLSAVLGYFTVWHRIRLLFL